ncbi:MAG: hypothetical protein AUJ20_06045 [Comamonadaceae bacterium CG1_02_60_18]|nr:MAG: hypothetical protein AUJ20_06045 [Comamonadaceae bacterium CG1_02_60_18]PIQ51729.1 MAG: hypothetical protein COW02_13580 [Comamonadaceae bacterium CG12_big_fil_rev_8_21_14_0_65_59_15]
MKTSLDFPDPLFRQLKAHAALQGSSLKNLVLNFVERGLRETQTVPATPPQDTRWEDQLDPFTKSLLGIAVPTDGRPTPTMDDYYAHLEKKHLGQNTP